MAASDGLNFSATAAKYSVLPPASTSASLSGLFMHDIPEEHLKMRQIKLKIFYVGLFSF